MAASCISVSLSTSGVIVAAGGRDNAVGKHTGRIAIAPPSVSGASLALSGLAGLSLTALGGSARSGRNAAIAARAADLEQGLELEELDAVDSTPAPPPPSSEGTKLYVGNLPWSVHSKQLAEVFQAVGNVELVEVIYDRESQKSRGFAFVTMSTALDAERAIDMLNGSELDGRVIKVNFPATRDGPRRDSFRSDRPPRREGGGGGSFSSENKLFVGNLSWAVDDVSLDTLFQEYGKVLEAKVVYDRETGRSRGFGFVTLSSSGEVNHAISSLDGKEFDKRLLRVNLAGDKPPPRESRYD